MGQASGRHKIHTRLRDLPNRLKRHVAGRFHEGAARDQIHCLAHCIDRHIVKHDDVGLRRQSLTHLIECFGLDFDPESRALFIRADATAIVMLPAALM